MAEFAALAEIALRIAAALLFLTAGWTKLRDAREFEILLGNYELLPAPLVTLTARVLPGFELLLGIALIVGMERSEPALAAAGLLLVFAAAMAINLWRGRTFIECGCRPGAPRQAGLKWNHVIRNIALAAVLAAGASAVSTPEFVTIMVGALAGIVLFGLDHIFAVLGDLPARAAVRS